MSAETKRALDNAIAAHIADEADGGIITGYVLHASYFSADLDSRQSTGYFAEYADDQPYHTGLGLAHMLADNYADRYYDTDDED